MKSMKNIAILLVALTAVIYTTARPCPQAIHHPNITGCSFCKEIAGIIKKEINAGNATINALTHAAEELCCDFSPPFICNECKAIVNATNTIINLIDEGFNATQICNKLHFCNGTKPEQIEYSDQ